MSNISIHEQRQNITVSEPRQDYHLPIASATVLGGIKVGNNLTITEDGTLSAQSEEYNLPTATASTLGGIKVGENLAINDGVLTADVDSVLNTASTNPVQNGIITNALNSVISDVSALDTRLDTAEDNISNNAEDISEISDDMSLLSTTLDNLSDDVETNTTNISANTDNIAQNTLDIGDLDTRLDTAEDTITDLGNSIDTMAGQINDVIRVVNTTVEYTHLLPVATWSDGDITLRRRGYIGFLFINLEGTLLLGANSTTTIYTFVNVENFPSYETSASILTDAGSIVASVNDQGEVKLTNPTSSAITLTKAYGNIPLIYGTV